MFLILFSFLSSLEMVDISDLMGGMGGERENGPM